MRMLFELEAPGVKPYLNLVLANLCPNNNTTNMDVDWKQQPTATMSFNETAKDPCALAVTLFKAKNYQACEDAYAQLIADKSLNNPFAPDFHRLRHNMLVASFLKENCTNVDKFYKEMRQLVLDADWLNNGDCLDEPAAVSFNVVVLYFHHKQYQNALDMIKKLTHHLTNTTNLVSARAMLLLIEIFARLQQFDDALKEIERFESQFKNAAIMLVHAEKGSVDAEAEAELDQQAEKEIRERLRELKVLCLLGKNSLAFAKRECKWLISGDDSKQGIRILIAAHLKARYEFLRGNCKKSLKVLANLKEVHANNYLSTGDNLDLILANNIGCLNYAMGRPTVGCTYFANASRFCDAAEYKNKRQPLYCRAYNKKYEILYNLGVGMLQMNQPPEQAYLYLSLCRKPFFSNPRLWLRIAECCVKIYVEDQAKCWTEKNKKVLQLLGEDAMHVPPLFQRTRVPDINLELPQGVPQPTLAYASDCIAIALKILETERLKTVETLHVKPSQPITNTIEISRLHANILCVGAFISANLQQYNTVVKYCTQILQFLNLPWSLARYACIYLGEALVKTSSTRKEEGLAYLRKALPPRPGPSGDTDNDIDSDDEDEVDRRRKRRAKADSTCQLPWSQIPLSESIETDSTIKYNQALGLVQASNSEAARELLEAFILSTAPKVPPPEIIALLVDIYIKEGNLESAKATAQKFSA